MQAKDNTDTDNPISVLCFGIVCLKTVSFCQADLHTKMEALTQNFHAVRKLQAIQRHNDNGSDDQIFNTWTIENFCKYMYLVKCHDDIWKGIQHWQGLLNLENFRAQHACN